LALNSDYTVTFNADPLTGGTITLLFTPTTGYYLTINRQVGASLTTNFSQAQNFNGANLDAALDRLLLLCQQNQNYALQRNLSYVINTYLPDASPYTQLPPLPQNFVWVGSAAGVIAAELAVSPRASVLQSMLANAAPGTDGARIVGYYDTVNSASTTVDAYLTSLFSKVNGASGATKIGYYDILNSVGVSLDVFLQNVRYVATDIGAPNTVTISIAASGFTLTAGQIFLVKIANTNTAASTLTINALAAVPIKVNVSQALMANMMLQNQEVLFVYDGTNMQLLNPSKVFYGGAVAMSAGQGITSATTALLDFDTTTFNPAGLVSLASKGFIINKAGYYRVNVNVQVVNTSTTDGCYINIHKNTVTTLKQIVGLPYTNTTITLAGSAIILFAVNDVVNLYMTNTHAADSITAGNADGNKSNFDIEYLGN